MKVSAIIVCAGNSTRMGGVNKILLPLGNSNVIGTALTAFQNTDSITDIVVVCRDQDREEIEKTAENIGITKLHAFAKGGDTRQKSVINGLKETAKDTELIAIHDGARPLVKLFQKLAGSKESETP